MRRPKAHGRCTVIHLHNLICEVGAQGISTLKGFHSAMQYQLKYQRLHCPAADGHNVSLQDLLAVPFESVILCC